MDAVLKLCLDTTDVERAFDEIDERLRRYSEDSGSVSENSRGESDPSGNDPSEESELLNRILSELEEIAGSLEGVAETAQNLAEIMSGVRDSMENASFIQSVTAV